MKILLVEDEPKLLAFLKEGFEVEGFEVDFAYDGQIGEMKINRNQYDIIILDIIVPYLNGLELCARIREKDANVPVIMLTAMSSTDDKLAGFDAGADDYLSKPFEFRELLARVNVLIKRTSGMVRRTNNLKVADLELDLDKKVAIRAGKTIELTSKEYQLLEYLMRNKGKVLSRVDIAEKVWEVDFDTNTNVIDVYITILRKKIDRDFEPKLIHTKIGLGYYLDN
ncbi:DNA-binding response OmpR family regulator [Breznakibacter xylanolyticus]|uniref:DNA-binding response OmpR family regulator n=1 Tax=Breznakibacter xylanolyticus TaxID=990 RepID=A0A2W7NVR4_9BACT|nr:response regulator transcription factor [Breznakibacter xylanolyticus]MBN2742318.1 response regulator transcription factor [Marinilabiliaceae bacterium]PZX20714.1 DNA-binding response OmpR family regulator [Breznakibacter xylanolyticus]